MDLTRPQLAQRPEAVEVEKNANLPSLLLHIAWVLYNNPVGRPLALALISLILVTAVVDGDGYSDPNSLSEQQRILEQSHSSLEFLSQFVEQGELSDARLMFIQRFIENNDSPFNAIVHYQLPNEYFGSWALDLGDVELESADTRFLQVRLNNQQITIPVELEEGLLEVLNIQGSYDAESQINYNLILHCRQGKDCEIQIVVRSASTTVRDSQGNEHSIISSVGHESTYILSGGHTNRRLGAQTSQGRSVVESIHSQAELALTELLNQH